MLAISGVLAATFLLPLAYRAESLALLLVSAPTLTRGPDAKPAPPPPRCLVLARARLGAFRHDHPRPRHARAGGRPRRSRSRSASAIPSRPRAWSWCPPRVFGVTTAGGRDRPDRGARARRLPRRAGLRRDRAGRAARACRSSTWSPSPTGSRPRTSSSCTTPRPTSRPSATTRGWDAELGLPTEIVPLSRPFGLWAGNLFQGVVKRDGAPVPHAEVEVEFYDEAGAARARRPS